MRNRNLYQTLDLDRNATQDEIKKAYRFYASKFHPDKHNGDKFFEKKFREIKEAYEILGDPIVRSAYDLELDSQNKENTEKDFTKKTSFDKHWTQNHNSQIVPADPVKEKRKKIL